MRVCVTAVGSGSQVCKLEQKALRFIAAAPNTSQGTRWTIQRRDADRPQQAERPYDVLMSIPAPTSPNPPYTVRWDQAKAARRAEPWPHADHAGAVGCDELQQRAARLLCVWAVQEDGTGIPPR